MNKTLLTASKFIAYSTVLFLLPFWVLAYFNPMAPFNIDSIGLVPMESAQVVGLSNIRGTVGGLRLGIIAMIIIGAYFKKRDVLLSVAILVGTVSAGRFISLVIDGWELIGFITAAGEVMITSSLLYIRSSISNEKK
ncbi:MAG: hypothetical protein OEV74_02610 [Cyclobacteriaceae bacterium]|jgi:hypothetical protein|nr:hypothetical protein [Cyclobacteriaceae bacterium]MDH4295145.1 hypothetical protein [Cyclobacteriaceae bacterium]MDH5249411.1 hypothetical protein [Cyclobacteriaceae bacterium]